MGEKFLLPAVAHTLEPKWPTAILAHYIVLHNNKLLITTMLRRMELTRHQPLTPALMTSISRSRETPAFASGNEIRGRCMRRKTCPFIFSAASRGAISWHAKWWYAGSTRSTLPPVSAHSSSSSDEESLDPEDSEQLDSSLLL